RLLVRAPRLQSVPVPVVLRGPALPPPAPLGGARPPDRRVRRERSAARRAVLPLHVPRPGGVLRRGGPRLRAPAAEPPAARPPPPALLLRREPGSAARGARALARADDGGLGNRPLLIARDEREEPAHVQMRVVLALDERAALAPERHRERLVTREPRDRVRE